MGVGDICGPHSSGNASFACFCASNQQVVAIDPSATASTRNLSSSRLSGREEGGIKSHGTSIKSSFILLEKWRRMVHVPTLDSCDSS